MDLIRQGVRSVRCRRCGHGRHGRDVRCGNGMLLALRAVHRISLRIGAIVSFGIGNAGMRMPACVKGELHTTKALR